MVVPFSVLIAESVLVCLCPVCVLCPLRLLVLEDVISFHCVL